MSKYQLYLLSFRLDSSRNHEFDKAELCILVDIMQIPEVITRERKHAAAIDALCVVMYKLSVP
ncbi:hypothetical protein F442_15870, partial [Phytophthora nicotianae P10297]